MRNILQIQLGCVAAEGLRKGRPDCWERTHLHCRHPAGVLEGGQLRHCRLPRHLVAADPHHQVHDAELVLLQAGPRARQWCLGQGARPGLVMAPDDGAQRRQPTCASSLHAPSATRLWVWEVPVESGVPLAKGMSDRQLAC